MPRKMLGGLVILIFTLVIWVYRTSHTEYNNTIILIKSNNYFIRDTVIKPKNATLCTRKPFLTIIVTSYVGHVELRSAHRRVMPLDYLLSKNTIRIFLLARIPKTEKYITQEAIEDESNNFGDILQGSFVENYRNLTHKHLMGLQWASTVCNRASFILKVDDDTVFNLDKTYDFLNNLSQSERTNIAIGYMLNDTRPRRNEQNKWYVTHEEYERNVYPPYLSGWYYIMSPYIANMITSEAKFHPFFWIDDIFVTGILTEVLGIKLKQVPSDYWLEYYELLECCLRDMVSKYIKCDHVVGPNGGRNNLIVEFNEAIRNCDKWKNCTLRSNEMSIKKTCVMYRERTIFSNGQGEVHNIGL